MNVWVVVLLLAAVLLGIWALVSAWSSRELKREEERRLLDDDQD